VQQQEGGLRSNRQADVVAHDQAGGSLEVLLLEEHARVTEQLAPVSLAQSLEDGDGRRATGDGRRRNGASFRARVPAERAV